MAIRAGVTLIGNFAESKAPEGLKVWIVTDDETALEEVWGLRAASLKGKVLKETQNIVQRVYTVSAHLRIFPVS